MKIISVVGARPNFIKIGPICRAIEQHNKKEPLFYPQSPITGHHSPITIDHLLVHTGQHYDYQMSRIFFKDLELPEPDVHLGVGSGTHAEQTGKIMLEFERVLLKEKPALVIVVGDVNSTLAAAVAAVKIHIPAAHVEAGLRSYDKAMPEEINRVLTDAISDYLFTPTQEAAENLRKEGIPDNKIHFVGNVMVDSLLNYKSKAESSLILNQLGLEKKNYAVVTLHRPSNVDDRNSLMNIMEILMQISFKIPIIFPIHPRTRTNLKSFKLDELFLGKGHLFLVDPLGYLDFVNLMMNSSFIITDSGGVQEETTILNIPCFTWRENTERKITVTQGTNMVVGREPEKIIDEVDGILEGKGKRGTRPELWDGQAAPRIVELLVKERG